MEKKPNHIFTEEYSDSEIKNIKANYLDEAHEEDWRLINARLKTPRNNVVIDVRSHHHFDTMTVHAALDQLVNESGLELPIAGLYWKEQKYPDANSFDISHVNKLIDYLENLYVQGKSSLLVTRLGQIDRNPINDHVTLIWPIKPGPPETIILPRYSERDFFNRQP